MYPSPTFFLAHIYPKTWRKLANSSIKRLVVLQQCMVLGWTLVIMLSLLLIDIDLIASNSYVIREVNLRYLFSWFLILHNCHSVLCMKAKLFSEETDTVQIQPKNSLQESQNILYLNSQNILCMNSQCILAL